jgi:hypothetical protein
MACCINQHTQIGAFADYKWKIIWKHLKILKVLVDAKKFQHDAGCINLKKLEEQT